MESPNIMQTPSGQEIENYIRDYKKRLLRIIDVAETYGIDPVLVSQPALFGSGVDDITGVDLERIRVGSIDGRLSWDILERYNEVTREIGEKKKILVIDIAKELPKSSTYFYDFFHFTNEGAKEVGDIVYYHLSPYLKGRYHEYVRQKDSIQGRGMPITSASGLLH